MIFTRNLSINTVSSSSSSFSDHGPGLHQRSLCHFRAFAKSSSNLLVHLLLQFEIVSKTRAAVVVAALLKPSLTHVQTVENIGKWIKWKLSERAFYSTPEKLRNIILNQSYWPLTKNIEKKVWREDLTFYNTSIHIGGLVQLKTVFGFGGCQDHFVRLFSPIIFTDKGHIMEVFAISKPFQRRRRKDVLFIPKRLKLGRSQKRHHFPRKSRQRWPLAWKCVSVMSSFF